MTNIPVKENPIEKRENISPGLAFGLLVEGRVVARDRSSLFVDLGPQKGTGVIYGREFYKAKDAIKNLNKGDVVHAKIVELENENGYVELSLKDAIEDISWQKLRDMKSKGEIIKIKVTGVNKGGLLSDIHNIPAFLPVSQLSPENYPRVEDGDKQRILKELQKFIGKTLAVKILDLFPQENKLILSEKAKTEEAIKEALKDYKEGDIIQCLVTGIADFGVFVRFPLPPELLLYENSGEDLFLGAAAGDNLTDDKSPNETGGSKSIEGLIHISELDWQLVQNPAEVVKVGQIIKAQIIKINNSQVFLSLKKLKDNPWESIERQYKKGDIIKGKVISFSLFGAFIEVLPKIRGLCHISGFRSQREMEESVKIGQIYDFEILLIDPKEHRLSLKLFQGDSL